MQHSLRAFYALLPDEHAARVWFDKARWPNGPECGVVNNAAWLRQARHWNCMGCNHQFSVTAGTPMHRTHLPLLVWAQAIYLIVASSKGISSMNLMEMLDVSYGTALAHEPPHPGHDGHRGTTGEVAALTQAPTAS